MICLSTKKSKIPFGIYTTSTSEIGYTERSLHFAMSLRLNLTWHVVWVLNSSSDARGLLKGVRMIPLGLERTILLIFVTHPCLPTPSLLFAFRLLFSCSVIWLFATQPHGLQPARLLSPWDFTGNNTGVSCHFLLQGIFLIQALNPNLLLRRRALYYQSTWVLRSVSQLTICPIFKLVTLN